jgi:hypothetical protein
MTAPNNIIARLDLAFDRAAERFPRSAPKWIYLSQADWDAYNRDRSEAWGSKVTCFSYRDVQIRLAKRSMLTVQHGCSVAIPTTRFNVPAAPPRHGIGRSISVGGDR